MTRPGQATVSPSSTAPTFWAPARTAESHPTKRSLTFPNPPPWRCSAAGSSASASSGASVLFANFRTRAFGFLPGPIFHVTPAPPTNVKDIVLARCHPSRRVHEARARAVAVVHGGPGWGPHHPPLGDYRH